MQSEAHASRPLLSMDPGAGTATAANRRGPPFLPPLPSASVRLAGASNDRMRRRANGQSAARRPLKGKCGIGGSPSSSSGLRRTAAMARARAVLPSVSTPSPFPLFYYSVFFRDERGGRSRRPLGIASATVEPVKSDRVELECVVADRSFVHKGRNTSRDAAGSLVSLSDPRQGERGHELCEQLHGKQKR